MLGLERDCLRITESLVRVGAPRSVRDLVDAAHHAWYSGVGVQVKLVVDWRCKRDDAELGGVRSDVELVDEVLYELNLFLKVVAPLAVWCVQQEHDVQLGPASCK